MKFKGRIHNELVAFIADTSSPTSTRNAILIEIWIANADRALNLDFFTKFRRTVWVEILEGKSFEVEGDRIV